MVDFRRPERVAEALGVEVDVEREGDLDAMFPHDGETHVVDERDSAAASPLGGEGLSMERLVDPDDGQHRQDVIREAVGSGATEPPPGEREGFDDDIVVGHEIVIADQVSKCRLGSLVTPVIGIEQRQQGRCVDEDAHAVGSSSR